MTTTPRRAILAGGCFWGVQELLRRRPGVISTRVGYSGGDVRRTRPTATTATTPRPIEIVFDPALISLPRAAGVLLPDPRPVDEEPPGQRRRPQLPLGDLLHHDEQKRVALDTIADVDASGLWPGKVVTEVEPGRRLLGGRAGAPGLPRAVSRTATPATTCARAGSSRSGSRDRVGRARRGSLRCRTRYLGGMARRALAVRHVLFEDLGILEQLLRQRGYEVAYAEAGADRIAPDLALEPDLLVVLGGPIGVGDIERYPFLAEEVAALAARLAVGAPTLGICLGAQLMAAALGAEVAPTGRMVFGFAPLTLTDEGRDSPLAELDGVPVLHWHGDQFAIPDGAVRLAETPGTSRTRPSPRECGARAAVPSRGRSGLSRAMADRACGGVCPRARASIRARCDPSRRPRPGARGRRSDDVRPLARRDLAEFAALTRTSWSMRSPIRSAVVRSSAMSRSWMTLPRAAITSVIASRASCASTRSSASAMISPRTVSIHCESAGMSWGAGR